MRKLFSQNGGQKHLESLSWGLVWSVISAKSAMVLYKGGGSRRVTVAAAVVAVAAAVVAMVPAA